MLQIKERLDRLQHKTLDEFPVRMLSGKQGAYKALPTPSQIESATFPIFGNSCLKLELRRELPPRSLSTIYNCIVHGQSTATITTHGLRKGLHWATLPELNLSERAGNYSNFFRKEGPGWQFTPRPSLLPSSRMKHAVLIGTRYSFNYFHFISDTIPRALIAEQERPGDAPPFLITQSAPQIHELLRRAFPRRVIREMKAEELILVDELVIPVSAAYSPDDPAYSHLSVFDAPLLTQVRDRLLCSHQEARSGHDILFIERPDYRMEGEERLRTIVNQADVISFMRRIGARIIKPELMTLSEQQAAFQNARLVVGMAGAAFANMIFCKDNSTALIICQNSTVHPEYFGFMADALNLRFAAIACAAVPGTSRHPSHLSVTVDTAVLGQAIDWALT